MPTLWSKHPMYAIGGVAGVVCSLVILASAFQLARWHMLIRGASVQAGSTGYDAKWIQLRGLVPASITVFVPTWLPPTSGVYRPRISPVAEGARGRIRLPIRTTVSPVIGPISSSRKRRQRLPVPYAST